MTTNRKWEEFALLLIDVQNDFWSKEVAEAFPDFPRNTARLLNLCRAEGIDVLHVRARFKPDRSDWMARYKLLDSIPCISGTPGPEVLPEARELPGEAVIYKQSYDSFCNPEVETWLRDRRKRYVLVAGLVTAVCVLLTGAAAAQRGFLVAVVEDCCADQPKSHGLVFDRYPNVMERVKVDQISTRLPAWKKQLADLAAVGVHA